MASISALAAAPPDRRPSRAAAVLVWGAPLAALLAGMGAEWLDFRALRVPFLLVVGCGVLATSYALSGARAGGRRFALTVLVGMATWGAGEALYTVIHSARGEPFHAGRFGPQPAQALGLIGVHALFLGLPTGLVAAALLHAPWLRARLARRAARADAEAA
ncbi:MAG: hypothetical protein KGK07_08540 [Chloroflexota bacterium]|nr:hypothetical protein [Chloroflexota bacterium]